METAAGPLSEHMVGLAGIAPGHRVLDIATGLGEPAVTAAHRVGPNGSVLATDFSAEMIGFGRRRADDLGLKNITFQQMDAQALDVIDASFDAVLCRWGLMFLDDLDAALRGILGALKPGGRFVTSIWGPPDGAPALSLGARVVHRHLGMPPPREGTKTPFAFSDVAAFQDRVAAIGFSHVQGDWINVRFDFASAEEFTQFRRDRSGVLKKAIAGYPEAEQEAAWADLREAARDFADEDGRVRLDNAAYWVMAER